MKKLSGAVALILSISILSYGTGNTFTKVRYNGGSIASNVKKDDWHNTLTVDSDKITLKFKDGATAQIDPKTVTGLSYGQEAHRRVGTMIALAIFLTPIALFGLMHKTRQHFIGIEWKDGDKKNGVLLQGDKDNYRGILMALRGVTGAPVSVAASERKYIPVGIDVIETDDTKKDDKKDDKKEDKKKDNN